MNSTDYIQFVSDIKHQILQSRYRAASLANREMLLLYYETGKRLSEKIKQQNWGTKVIERIADDLQKELPGLRGFSASNLKNMRLLASEYEKLNNFIDFQTYTIRQSVTVQLENDTNSIGQSVTVQLQNIENEENIICQSVTGKLENRQETVNSIMQLLTAQLQTADNEQKKATFCFIENIFLKIGFTHHILLINKCKDLRERLFYMQRTVSNQWSVSLLEHHIESRLYEQKGKLFNNFDKTLPQKLYTHATDAFKGEYLLDFINIEEQDDERVFENAIVMNIKKFIMSIGNDFAFMGNQYRIMIEDDEYFIDLLFFHRRLQSMVAFELKRGKFKAEYAGKMNLYLSAIDQYIKQPQENPSIGIILCKEKNDRTVEFAFRDINKAMGVATYKTSRELPQQFKGLLPDAETLKQLL